LKKGKNEMDKKKFVLYSGLVLFSAVAGFLVGQARLHKNKNQIKNEAYCITLYDYMIKASSAKKGSLERKTDIYMLESLIKGREGIYTQCCPKYYKAAKEYLLKK
jgi:hypothetical protein